MLRQAVMLALDNLRAGRMTWLSSADGNACVEPPYKDGYPFHKHSYSEMVQLVAGQAKLNTADNPFTLSLKTPCLILPETVHAESFFHRRYPYTVLWFIFGPGGFNIFVSTYTPKNGFRVLPEKIFGLTRNVKSFWELTTNRDLPQDPLLQAEFQAQGIQLLLEAVDRLKNPAAAKLDHRKLLVQQVQEFIEYHYHENFSVEDLAQMVHCTPNYLNGIFRKITGEPIHRFILKRRLESARKQLSEPNSSIKEIAYKLGFQDPLYFSRLFKKYFGVSPSQWR